jgi:hypothetical protein
MFLSIWNLFSTGGFFLRQYCVFLRQYCVFLRQYCVFLRQYCVFLRQYCVFPRQYCVPLSESGKLSVNSLFYRNICCTGNKRRARLSSEVPRYFRTQDKDDQLSLLETDTSQIFTKVNHKKDTG